MERTRGPTSMRQFPPHITIPTPMYEVRARGPYARSTLGVTIPVRLAKNDAKAIDKIAKQMGIPRSTFLRWCALYTAKALQEHIERVDAQRDYDEAKKKINSLDKQD